MILEPAPSFSRLVPTNCGAAGNTGLRWYPVEDPAISTLPQEALCAGQHPPAAMNRQKKRSFFWVSGPLQHFSGA